MDDSNETNVMDVRCPSCGGDSLVACAVTVMYVPFSSVKATTFLGNTVYRELPDTTGNYNTEDAEPHAFMCSSCGKRWERLEDLVEELNDNHGE